MSSWFVEIHTTSEPTTAVQWPSCCACCGQAAETSTNAIILVPIRDLRVPLCRVCKDHVRMPLERLLPAVLAACAWILLIVSIFGGGPIAAILGLGGLYAILWWTLTHRGRTPTCTTRMKPPVVTGMARHGERVWLFTSEAYARAFAAANGSTTVWRQGEKKPA